MLYISIRSNVRRIVLKNQISPPSLALFGIDLLCDGLSWFGILCHLRDERWHYQLYICSKLTMDMIKQCSEEFYLNMLKCMSLA